MDSFSSYGSGATDARPSALVVETNGLIGVELSDLLEKEAGCRVCGMAMTAKEAVQAIEKLGPDLVLANLRVFTDQGISLDGIVDGNHRLILITADQQAADEFASGFPCLMKPFSSQQLTQMIETVLGR